MKIIQHGKYYGKDYKFVCADCGCIFEENFQDVSFSYADDFGLIERVASVYTKCPECGCYTSSEVKIYDNNETRIQLY